MCLWDYGSFRQYIPYYRGNYRNCCKFSARHLLLKDVHQPVAIVTPSLSVTHTQKHGRTSSAETTICLRSHVAQVHAFRTEQMSPDVAGLGVNTEHRLEAFPVGIHWRPVPFHQKVIVPQPLRQVVVMHHHPASCPDPPRKLFGLLESS